MPALSPPLSQRKPEFSVSHPFGKELAQVSELVENFGLRDNVHIMDEEEQDLARKGLSRLPAEDYLSEVHELFATFFTAEPSAPSEPVWI